MTVAHGNGEVPMASLTWIAPRGMMQY